MLLRYQEEIRNGRGRRFTVVPTSLESSERSSVECPPSRVGRKVFRPEYPDRTSVPGTMGVDDWCCPGGTRIRRSTTPADGRPTSTSTRDRGLSTTGPRASTLTGRPPFYTQGPSRSSDPTPSVLRVPVSPRRESSRSQYVLRRDLLHRRPWTSTNWSTTPA